MLITLCYILHANLESHTKLHCTSFGFHIARQTFSESYIKISMLFLSFQSFTISDRIGEMTSPIEVSGRDGYRGWGCLWRSTPVLCSIVRCGRFCCYICYDMQGGWPPVGIHVHLVLYMVRFVVDMVYYDMIYYLPWHTMVCYGILWYTLVHQGIVYGGWPPTLCMTDRRLTKLPDYCRRLLNPSRPHDGDDVVHTKVIMISVSWFMVMMEASISPSTSPPILHSPSFLVSSIFC